jgi:hypothetical protein
MRESQTRSDELAARELDCDEDGARWEERLRRVAKARADKPE